MKTTATAILLLSLTSCGTMFSQNGVDLMVTSKPSGASISLDGSDMGKTPRQIHVKQNARGHVTVQMPGYIPMTRKMSTSFNGTTLLNIFIPFGFIGIAIDAATGNISNWDGSSMHFILPKEPTK